MAADEGSGRTAEPAYTIVGFYGDNAQPYVTKVYTFNGPEAALDLAHEACADVNDMTVAEVDLEILAIFHGEPVLVDFDLAACSTSGKERSGYEPS